MPWVQRLLPALVLANFLAMAYLLALDDRGIGSAEELTHRPFIVVYFIFATWIGGALWTQIRGSRAIRTAAFIALAGLLAVPAIMGRGLYQHPGMRGYSDIAVPRAIVDVASYLRAQSGARDVVQDAQLDPVGALTTLSERRTFVRRPLADTRLGADRIAARAAQVAAVLASTDPGADARVLGIDWFVLHPDDHPAWPAALTPVFEAGGYRVYHF
jgi:hypothetical protein